MKAYPETTTISHTGDLDAHRPKPGLYLALGKIAIPDHRLAALGIVAARILGSQHGHFRLYRLRQEALRALA